MTITSSTAVVEELVQVHPQEVVLPQLKVLYKEEIDEAIGEALRLLSAYRTRVVGVVSTSIDPVTAGLGHNNVAVRVHS